MTKTQRTALYQKHIVCNAKMADFAGWEMPIHYPPGIIQEHLLCRKTAGLFDVSHMGRFWIGGKNAASFLDYTLTNNVKGLSVGQSHYTILAQLDGGAIDDAWLYRFEPGGFVLVVNASNKEKDWQYLQLLKRDFPGVELEDLSDALAMVALQGPKSQAILQQLLTSDDLPKPSRNACGFAGIAGCEVKIGRTGYTGEPTCFEIMMPATDAVRIWDELIRLGASPVGLGARDTLRLEASLPLYGHEMGTDSEGRIMPILASPATKYALGEMDKKKDFVGRFAIEKQLAALERYKRGDFSDCLDLPKRIVALRILDKGIARQGAQIFYQGKNVGVITSGTIAPYWKYDDKTTEPVEYDHRSIALAYLDCSLSAGGEVEIDVRGRMLKAKIVKRNLKALTVSAIAVIE